jgi:type IV pilus assembly protein PilO
MPLNKDQQKIVVLLVMVVIGVYAYYTQLLKPTLLRIKDDQVKYEDLKAKIETAERQARRLPAMREELERLQVDLSNLEKQLPKDKDVPNIIRILTREAAQENLTFVKLSPKPLSKKEFFEVIPFEVNFTGPLQAFTRFLSSLGQQDRIFQAQGINLSPSGSAVDGGGVQNLSISLTILTYAYAG